MQETYVTLFFAKICEAFWLSILSSKIMVVSFSKYKLTRKKIQQNPMIKFSLLDFFQYTQHDVEQLL